MMMKTVIILIILFLCGCSLFKKTSRTNDSAKKSSLQQLESTQLFLKSVGRETQIFTYWNDSGFYQHQFIKEVSKERASAQLKSEEKQISTEKQTNRKSEPFKVWFYLGGLILLFGGFVLYKKLM